MIRKAGRIGWNGCSKVLDSEKETGFADVQFK